MTVLRMTRLYAVLLNNLKDGTPYTRCICVEPSPSMQPSRALHSLLRKEWHHMAKRIAVAQATEVETSCREPGLSPDRSIKE